MNYGKKPVGDVHYPWWNEAPWHDAKVAMIYGPAWLTTPSAPELNTQYNWGRKRSATLNAEALIIVACLQLPEFRIHLFWLSHRARTLTPSWLTSEDTKFSQRHLKATSWIKTSRLSCLPTDVPFGNTISAAPWHRLPTSASAAVTNPRQWKMTCLHQPCKGDTQIHSTAEKPSKFSQ